MITRTHERDGVSSDAEYSECLHYRYSLTRVWNPDAPRALFVMLNPSTATEIANDPTVERCERRARRLGFGAFRVCNIFAWRSTDPRALALQTDPVGPGNDAAIAAGCDWACRTPEDRAVCAWGNHGNLLDRGPEVERLMRTRPVQLCHLGLTAAGHPRHPLYVGYARPLTSWPAGSQAQAGPFGE